MAYAQKSILETLGYVFTSTNGGWEVTLPKPYDNGDCLVTECWHEEFDDAVNTAFEDALENGTYPWQEFFDTQSGAVLWRHRYYGFGDAGGIAGGGDGWGSYADCLAAVRAEGHTDEVGSTPEELGEYAICILSGDEYVRALAKMGDSVEAVYGKFGNMRERYEQAYAALARDEDEDPLSLDEVGSLALDYGLDDEHAQLLLAAAQQPLGQPSPPLLPTQFMRDGDGPFVAEDAWSSVRDQEAKLAVLFAVLTPAQQECALAAFGWEPL